MKKVFFVLLFLTISMLSLSASDYTVRNLRVSKGINAETNTCSNNFTISFDSPKFTPSNSRWYYYYLVFEDRNEDNYFMDTGGYYTNHYGWYQRAEYPVIKCGLGYGDVTGNQNVYGEGISVNHTNVSVDDNAQPVTDVFLKSGYISGNSKVISIDKKPIGNKIKVLVFSYYFNPGSGNSGFIYNYTSLIVNIEIDKPEINLNDVKVYTDSNSDEAAVINGNNKYNVVKTSSNGSDTTKIWLSVSASDKSGISKYKVVTNGSTSKIIESETINKESFSVPMDGDNTFTIYAYDSWYYESAPYRIQVYKDSVAPTGDLLVNAGNMIKENDISYISGNATISLGSCNPDISELSYEWQITDLINNISLNPEDLNISANQNAEISREGKYEIVAKLKKTSGMIGFSSPVTIVIDNHCDNIDSLEISLNQKSNLIKSISCRPVITSSDIAGFDLYCYVSRNGSAYEYADEKLGNSITDTGSFSLDDLNIDRSKRNTIKISCIAYDHLNNRAGSGNLNENSIVIPARIDIKSIKSVFDKETGKIKNVLTLENSSTELLDYEELYLNRIPEDSLKNLITSDFYETEKLKIMADEGNNEITDFIDSSSGHNYMKYEISGKIKDSNIIETAVYSDKFMTANCPGNLFFKIKGNESDNSEYVGIASDGTKCFENSKLTLKKDCKAFVNFKGYEKDGDSWEIYLNRIYETNGIRCRQLLYKSKSREENNIPVLLYFGNNNLIFEWKEKNSAGDIIDSETEIYNVFVASTFENDEYSITISEGILANSEGIKTRPGEILSFSVSNDLIANWDFGDGESETAGKASHYYSQKKDQNTDTAEYKMTVSVENLDTIEIPVYVKDTQQGSLLIDEIWRGPHSVLGTVTVPLDKTLKICAAEKDDNTVINYVNSNVDNPAKIYVAGEINISGTDAVIFNNLSSFDCDGLVVVGKAFVEGAEFSGFDRAIVTKAGESDFTEIENCIFNQNKIGIHIFGNCIIRNIKLSDNAEYGIKEESGATVQTEQQFDEESREYYRFR